VDQSKGSTSEITQEYEIPFNSRLFMGWYFRTHDNMWSKVWWFNCFAMLDRTVLQ